MSSIRMRLFLILLAATGVVWLSAVIWLQWTSRAEVGRVLDRRLEEAAHMVASLLARGDIDPATLADIATQGGAPDLPMIGSYDYGRQLSCQVWGLDGRLISNSAGAPDARLAGEEAEGFSQTVAGNETWRVYSLIDRDLGVRVMVGDALSVREGLVNRVTFGLLIPALLALPFLAGLIWWSLGRGLQPLDRMAAELTARPASDLGQLPDARAPRELRPMIAALNGLFQRVAQARARERNFTAFAAHELKTPLAGLKTQAQIAAIAPDEATRRHALAQLARGVGRTDRMVRQLLDMAAIESAEVEAAPAAAALVLTDLLRDLAPLAAARGIALQPALECGGWVTGQAALLGSAMRNIVENALNAAPPGSAVEITLRCQGGRALFRVADRGPGIAGADRPRVTERFYRGAHGGPSGSGLGLAIVEEAALRMGGRLHLRPRPGGGETVELDLPAG